MDTIISYVENMFKALPKTKELRNLKQDILINMEEKYNELKSEGKSENEAIGIVISDFGNIDEIIKEFGIETHEGNEVDNLPSVTLEEARVFLKDSKRCNLLISIGVMLCMFGASLLILLYQLYEDGVIFRGFSEDKVAFLPVTILLLFVGVAVTIFIFSGISMEKYKFIEKGFFNLEPSAKMFIKEESARCRAKVTIGTIVGVVICILSPIIIFAGGLISESGYVYGTIVLILVIAVAVFLFINVSACDEGHKKLLKLGEYSIEARKGNKVIGAVGSVVWPLAVVVFLVWGFIYNGWGISWIVFPIVGILFGIFCSVYKTVMGIEED